MNILPATLSKRVKRATKELLGVAQWDKPIGPSTERWDDRMEEPVAPSSYEEQIYASVIRAGDVCYDIGANEGNVTMLFARLVGAAGVVVSFEPVPPMYGRLCNRIVNASTTKASIIPVPIGLANESSVGFIQVPYGIFGMGSMAAASEWQRAQAGSTLTAYSARFTALDEFLRLTGLRPPTFLKIDVEGAELLVLQGAMQTLNASRPAMLIEIFAPWEKAFGYTPAAVFSLLMKMGYEFLFACPEGLVPYRPTKEHPFPPGYRLGYNVIAAVKERYADRLSALESLYVGGAEVPLSMPPPPIANVIA
jgi:FkbM family methyltransferase